MPQHGKPYRHYKISHTQKYHHCVIPFIWNIQYRQTHREKINSCQGLGKGDDGDWLFNEYRVSFHDDENVLKLDSNNGYIPLWMPLSIFKYFKIYLN